MQTLDSTPATMIYGINETVDGGISVMTASNLQMYDSKGTLQGKIILT